MRKILSVLLLLVGGGVFAAAPDASGLRLDGKVIVRKVSPATARVIVVRDAGEARVLDKDLSHFTLTLELQSSYLLSFECDGCVTKQLLFDTHTPAGPTAYDFPFQVTLEPPPTKEPFAYAGPVGLIRYDEAISDFGYDTDYKIARNDVLAERLEEVRSRIARSEASSMSVVTAPSATPPAAPVEEPLVVVMEAAVPAVAPVASPDAPKGHFEELAPTRSEAAPLVHPLEAKADPAPAPVPVPVVEEHRSEKVEAPAPLTRMPEARPKPVVPVIPVQPIEAEATVLQADGRTEEVVAEKLRVSTIVRIRQGGLLTEYRRVAHYYGGVSYFKDGLSCTEKTYLDGIAQ